MSHVFASKTDPSVTPHPELAAKCREFDTQIGASGDTPRLLVWTGAAPPTLEEAQEIVGGRHTPRPPMGQLLNEDANLKKMRAILNLSVHHKPRQQVLPEHRRKVWRMPVMGTALLLVADAMG